MRVLCALVLVAVVVTGCAAPDAQPLADPSPAPAPPTSSAPSSPESPEPEEPEETEQPTASASAVPDRFRSSVSRIDPATRRRMVGASHDPGRCPVPLADLRLLRLSYVDFAGATRTGELVVAAAVAQDVVGVFRRLFEAEFPIRRMRLVSAYDGDDNASMAANNTSAYNCRTVAGTDTFSAHAFGRAIDINPVQNPYVLPSGGVLPPAGRRFLDVDRSPGAAPGRGVIVSDDVVLRAFRDVGWSWGGLWTDPDYQHFAAP